MKRIGLFSIVAIIAFVLSLTACGGGSSSPSSNFPFGEYVSVLKNAADVSDALKEKLNEVKDLSDLGKLMEESKSEEQKYKDAVKALVEQDMGKDVALEIAEGAPFVLEAPLKFGKSLVYSDAIWMKLEGELALNGAVNLPEGKTALVANVDVLDKDGNVLYTKKNFATFKGVKNEDGTFSVPADTKVTVGEYVIMKDKNVEDWLKAAEMVLVVAE